jgi:hypothetical protein
MMETAAQDVRETAECHLEAFKLRPGLTETDLEVQAAFMDICMEARRNNHDSPEFVMTCCTRTPVTRHGPGFSVFESA